MMDEFSRLSRAKKKNRVGGQNQAGSCKLKADFSEKSQNTGDEAPFLKVWTPPSSQAP